MFLLLPPELIKVPEYNHVLPSNLAKMVAHSPQLNSINMKSVHMYRILFGRTQSLHQLSQYYLQNEPPLRLHRLVLDTCQLRFDAITIPHLKYLTSLSLTKIKDTSDLKPTYESDEVNPDSEEIKIEQKRWGSSLEEIWTALSKADINLEEITVDVVVPAFIAYLASYSSLRILNLTGRASNQKPTTLPPNFMQSLWPITFSLSENLTFVLLTKDCGVSASINLSLISQCLNLEELGVSIISSQVELVPVVGSSSCSTCLDVIVSVIIFD